jgi:hypothetical protein
MKAVCILFVAFAFVALAQPPPAWWSSRGVIVPNAQPDDFALANLGQVKQFARAAVLEFEAKLPGGAGVVLHQKVTAWDNPAEPPDDYVVVTHGQLKHLLDAFYARLESVRAVMAPDWSPVVAPWAGGVTGLASAQNTAVANIGQVKHAFAGLEGDRAARSLLNSQSIDPTAAGYRFGLGWLNDSDGDGVSDFDELLVGSDPLSSPPAGPGVSESSAVVVFTDWRH